MSGFEEARAHARRFARERRIRRREDIEDLEGEAVLAILENGGDYLTNVVDAAMMWWLRAEQRQKDIVRELSK